MGRVVQVIACWFGGRRVPDPRAISDPLVYVRHQAEALRARRRALDTEFVFVFSGPTPDGARALVESVVGATWFERENAGLSYGAYSAAFDRVEGRVDHWVLCEDDYVPAVDDFDALMLGMLDDAGPRCGFSCAKLGPSSDGRPHASVFIGMLPDAALREAAVRAGGSLPVPRAGYQRGEVEGQVGWSHLLLDCGWTLSEWYPRRTTAFWDGEMLWMEGADSALFVPVQAFGIQPSQRYISRAGPRDGPTLGVVVITQGNNLFGRALESVLAQDLRPGDEVVVVSDGPRPPARSAYLQLRARGLPPGAYRQCPPGRSTAQLRDAGVALTGADYVAVLDESREVPRGTFAAARAMAARVPKREIRLRGSPTFAPRS